MPDTDIQHFQMILGMAILFAMLGTLLLTLLSRSIGGAWIILSAILASLLLAYQPLIGASLFAGFKTDLLRRILLAATVFTAALIVCSLRRLPTSARIALALIGPALLLYWVFLHFDLTVPRQTLFVYKIVPISLGIFIAWILIEPLETRSPGVAAPLVITVVTAGIAFLLMISTENQAGAIAPLIPATAGGATLGMLLAATLKRPGSCARGPTLLWLTLTGSLLAFLWIDTDHLPTPYLMWIAGALPLAWVPQIGFIRRQKPWRRELFRLVLVLIPVTIGIALAFRQHKREAVESGDEYGLMWNEDQIVISRSTNTGDFLPLADLRIDTP